MSIFDSPAVNFHVDDDLEYVFVPTVLSLFNHVNTALKGIHDRIDETVRTLATGSMTLLSGSAARIGAAVPPDNRVSA